MSDLLFALAVTAVVLAFLAWWTLSRGHDWTVTGAGFQSTDRGKTIKMGGVAGCWRITRVTDTSHAVVVRCRRWWHRGHGAAS